MYHRYLQSFTLELLLRCLQFFCYTGRCRSQLFDKKEKKMSISKLLFSTEGRIPRSIYWYYTLGYSGAYAVATFIDAAFGTFDDSSVLGLFSGLLSLVGIITGLAVAIKRCHDRDHSGWYLLIGLIPFLNLWVVIELAFLKGTYGYNKYGPDPLLEKIS